MIKITVVDTKFKEVEQYTEEDFSLNFLMGRDIPHCVLIFHKDNVHKSYDLNREFNERGCSIKDFESWYEKSLCVFKSRLQLLEEVI